ncbi:MAG: reverse transcriptase family protein [Parashewanella sp.]
MSYRYRFEKRNTKSIGSIENLLKALDLTQKHLDELLSLPEEQWYTSKEIPKSSGELRTVNNPHKFLRRFQRRINRRIFHQPYQRVGLIKWPNYLFGSVPSDPLQLNMSKDYIACAGMHCQAKSVLKMDIANFFDNINEQHVLNIFLNLLKFPNDVAELLTKICCYKGNVIQGALTSSYVASAVLFDLEPKVVKRIHEKKLTYTRLVDDITVTSRSSKYNFAYVKSLIIDMLYKKGLPTNDSKTQEESLSSSDILIHGLRICFKEPRLPSKEVGKIRASVKSIETFAKDPVFRTSKEYREIFNKSLGRVNRLKRLKHKQFEPLFNRLNRIKPLPCKSDIKRARKLVYKIEGLYSKYGDGYRYRKMYFKAHYELNILQRTFSNTAVELREKLKGIKPKYEN